MKKQITMQEKSERFRKAVGIFNLISTCCCCAMSTVVLLNTFTTHPEWLGLLYLVLTIVLAVVGVFCALSCIILSTKLRKLKKQNVNEDKDIS